MTDLLVIGGGVHGAAIARDAALRGLAVVLAERVDLAWGTSSRSSKLAHGGLRYLERLEFRLVRESLAERNLLLTLAPHLAWPLPFLVPLDGPAPRAGWMIRTGLVVYDLLAGRSSLPRHRVVPGKAAELLAPGLRGSGLTRAALYHDAGMDDARLVIELALDAARHGARILTHHEAVALLSDGDRVIGATITGPAGSRQDIRARLTVLACGPWTDEVARRMLTDEVTQRTTTDEVTQRTTTDEVTQRTTTDEVTHPRLLVTQGTHVFTRRPLARDAAVMLATPDRRVFFLVPWRGGTLIGTTDTAWHGPADAVRASPADIDYLLDAVNAALPEARLTRADVVATQSGLRPLVAPSRPGAPSSISRDFHLDSTEPGLIVVEGGKYTIFRRLAERVVDQAAREVLAAEPTRQLSACSTDTRLLPGGHAEYPTWSPAEVARLAARGVPSESAARLVARYGARAAELVEAAAGDAALLAPACEHHPHLPVEALVAVRDEFAATASDALLRRLDLGWWDCPGLACAPRFAAALRLGGLPASATPDDLPQVRADILEHWRG